MDRKTEAYNALRKMIVDNEFPGGAPLREVELSERLKMSRSPIREALSRLETEGVVVSYPGRGSFLKKLTPSDAEEIYELRTMFELWAIKRAINVITD